MLPVEFAAGPPLSTRTVSSSLTLVFADMICFTLVFSVSAGVSSSFRSSFCMDARRFSHHSFSAAVWAWISSSRLRNTVVAAISLADWKIVVPQFAWSAFAFRTYQFKKQQGGDIVNTSITTSRSSASISCSALRNLCQRSSPTLPLCRRVLHACLAVLIWIIRWISSTARRRSAALITLSGTFGAFSLPSSGSRCKSDR